MKEYIVMTNDEEGGVSLEIVSEGELLERLNDSEDDYGSRCFSLDSIKEETDGRSWDFGNEGERGMIIFKANGIVVPKPKEREVIKEWEI